MIKYDEYKILCKIRVLALGDKIYKNEVVRFTTVGYLTIKDYGVFEPEGWEYEIDDSECYNIDYYKNRMMYDMELVRANDIIKISRSKNLDLSKILQVDEIEIDMNKIITKEDV